MDGKGRICRWFKSGLNDKSVAVVGEALVQPQSAIEGTKMLVSLFPAIPFIICVGLLYYYEINKGMEIQLEKELKERRNNKIEKE